MFNRQFPECFIELLAYFSYSKEIKYFEMR